MPDFTAAQQINLLTPAELQAFVLATQNVVLCPDQILALQQFRMPPPPIPEGWAQWFDSAREGRW